MVNTPNFREFYQKTPILIGESDRLAVNSVAKTIGSEHKYTHWLIVLEGIEMDVNIKWKVIIYPSRANGEFDYLLPYFVSSLFESIHDAIDYSKKIEHKAKQGELTTIETVLN